TRDCFTSQLSATRDISAPRIRTHRFPMHLFGNTSRFQAKASSLAHSGTAPSEAQSCCRSRSIALRSARLDLAPQPMQGAYVKCRLLNSELPMPEWMRRGNYYSQHE